MTVEKEEYSSGLQRFFAETGVPYRQQGSEFIVLRGEDEEILAAGMTWTNDLHPMRRYLYVSVDAHYRRRGSGTTVYRALETLYPDAKWQAMIDSDNEEAAIWLERIGFRCVRKCYCIEVLCADMKKEAIQEIVLTPFCDLTQTQAEYLLTMLRNDYARKHEHVSPLNEEYDEAVFGICALKGIDNKESFCLIENGQIMAYVCCHDGEERHTRAVGYVGQRIESREKYRQFLLNFINRSFETTGELLLEADDCDGDAMELLSLFDILPEYSYDTYVTP